jgi:hypothetical protein
VQRSSFWKYVKGQYFSPKDLITEGAHHVLRKQQAVTPDNMLAITGDTAGPLERTCGALPAAGRVQSYVRDHQPSAVHTLIASVCRFLEVTAPSGSLRVHERWVKGQLNWPVLFEGVWVEERLCPSVERIQMSCEIAITVFTIIPPRQDTLTSALTVVHSIAFTANPCDLPLQAQIRHQRVCVAVEAHVTMRACIVAPAVYACVRKAL